MSKPSFFIINSADSFCYDPELYAENNTNPALSGYPKCAPEEPYLYVLLRWLMFHSLEDHKTISYAHSLANLQTAFREVDWGEIDKDEDGICTEYFDPIIELFPNIGTGSCGERILPSAEWRDYFHDKTLMLERARLKRNALPASGSYFLGEGTGKGDPNEKAINKFIVDCLINISNEVPVTWVVGVGDPMKIIDKHVQFRVHRFRKLKETSPNLINTWGPVQQRVYEDPLLFSRFLEGTLDTSQVMIYSLASQLGRYLNYYRHVDAIVHDKKLLTAKNLTIVYRDIESKLDNPPVFEDNIWINEQGVDLRETIYNPNTSDPEVAKIYAAYNKIKSKL